MMGSTHLTGMTELPPKPIVSTYCSCKQISQSLITNEDIMPLKPHGLHKTVKQHSLSSLSRGCALIFSLKHDAVNGQGQNAPAIQASTCCEIPCRPFPDTSSRVPRALIVPMYRNLASDAIKYFNRLSSRRAKSWYRVGHPE